MTTSPNYIYYTHSPPLQGGIKWGFAQANKQNQSKVNPSPATAGSPLTKGS